MPPCLNTVYTCIRTHINTHARTFTFQFSVQGFFDPACATFTPSHPHQVAQEWRVDAIHPGYGFLSENEEFCSAVEAAGIAWLGPTAKTLHDFALKHVARRIAEDAGVRMHAHVT
jgi:pyruvate carboxylase